MRQIGFMQGRLSPQVDSKIQAFPWDYWEAEFETAENLGLHLMEWTLDQHRLYQNPLMTEEGQSRIRALSDRYGVTVRSLTGDCFMQAPFYKASGETRARLLEDLGAILNACSALGVRWVVVPLVDNGGLETDLHRESLLDGLLPLAPWLRDKSIAVVFESDFIPPALKRFIDDFPADCFGVNFDIGNSAGLGFDARAEISAYGRRILNVHVKDRELGGTTVPLGAGSADFPRVFTALAKAGYRGDFILQTARAADGDHAGAIARYRDMVKDCLAQYAA